MLEVLLGYHISDLILADFFGCIRWIAQSSENLYICTYFCGTPLMLIFIAVILDARIDKHFLNNVMIKLLYKQSSIKYY